MNPISDLIKKSVNETTDKLRIAVPFISSFAKKIINEKNSQNIQDKRLVTKFDERNINTFDLPTLEYLLDCGFEIYYNNKIHLKLYITDNNTYITSSNLTNGGFENNIELTVNIDSKNFDNCEEIFENLWLESKTNRVTKELINQNRDKYEVLKKRQKFEKLKVTEVKENFNVEKLNIQLLIDKIFNSKEDHSLVLERTYDANKKRNEIRKTVKTEKFDTTLYYSPKGHPKRYDNLYYNFVYGIESKLAGTGLREAQFKDSFEHQDFKKVIDFIIPESIGLEPWNLSDNKNLFNFCNGLFDFIIPQYSEAIPIRLASYFYPDYFLPIFKLNHLQKVCDALGIETEAKTKGERFYAYNLFLKDKMKDIPFDNYIKSGMIYQLLYSVELYKRIENGEDFESIKKSYKKIWIKNYIDKAKSILKNINAI
tara:strand:- start:377 stop:1654 length:1278 start_codon:yes stop_codon:yes gene_type:complete